MNKYEQLIEYIINDDEAKAKAVFHDIVVAKSREIYESLMDEEGHEGPGGNEVEGLTDEVTADEEGMQEGDDEFAGDEEFGTDDDMGDDGMGSDEEGGEEEIEDRVMDLESALDELKAEFDKLMADEQGDEEGDFGGEMGGDDMGGEEDFGGDMGMDEPEDEGMYMEGENPFAKSGSGSAASGKKGSGSGSAASGKKGSGSGSGSGKKSAAESIREYVEKVSDGHGAEKGGDAEGHEVGAKGSSVSVNKNHLVAGKNDMGGTAANIAKGASEQAPDGTSPKGKAGGFVKNAQEIDVAKRNVNKPGGNKGAQNYYGKKETSWEKAHGKEGQTTDGSVPVSKNSLVK